VSDPATSAPLLHFRAIQCPACASVDAKFLFEAIDRLHGIPGTFHYVRCRTCGLGFMNPQVIPADIPNLYPPDYAPHSVQTFLAREIPRSPIKRLKSRLARWITNDPLDASLNLGQSSRVLDVGCGSGEFLHRVHRATGAHVFGIDFSPNAQASAQQSFSIPVFVGTIEDYLHNQEPFDLITAWWLFEHVSDPRSFLTSVRRLLKRTGTFLFSVPNLASLNARLFRSKWYHLDCPRHLFLYTPKSLRRLLHDSGFRIDSIRYDKTPWGLLGSLQYFFYDTNLDPQTANRLRGNARLWKPLLPLTIALGLLRISDTMTVRASMR
jgi:SAM-dependent methyltransferase